MRVYGLDFTSAPSRRKPLVALRCTLDDDVLRVEDAEMLTGFPAFEEFLRRPGPWMCGMDFPFGQPRSLVSAFGWPQGWEGYVAAVSALPKEEFEARIVADMARRPAGSKYRYRLADKRSGSSSAMRIFRVPVGKMFYQGAPRLLASGVSVEPCRPTEDTRVVVEAYPAVIARRFLGRAGYKSDEKRKQTPDQRAAREKLIDGLGSEALRRNYGFTVAMSDSWRETLAADASADALDSLLCAVQAAWSYRNRERGWGIPPECDPDEGWILDPLLLDAEEA